MEESPFQVNEEVELGSLSDVPERDLLPAARNILFEVKGGKIRSVGVQASEAVSFENPCVLKFFSPNLEIVEGIPALAQDGSSIMKYKGKYVFPEITVWANPELKTSDWYKSRRYLADIKIFLTALGFDVRQPPALNDEFIQQVTGMKLRGSILRRKVQVQDESGKWVDTEDEKNTYAYWKRAE